MGFNRAFIRVPLVGDVSLTYSEGLVIKAIPYGGIQDDQTLSFHRCRRVGQNPTNDFPSSTSLY